MVSFRYFVLIMGKDKKKDVKTLSIRLPKTVAVALQKRAKQAQRSINGQIVHELQGNQIEWPSIIGPPQSSVFKVSGLK